MRTNAFKIQRNNALIVKVHSSQYIFRLLINPIFLARFLITLDPLNIIFALLSGYGFAWVSHFFIEKNKPATFTYPFFSLLSDYIMFWEILRGKHKIF